MGKGKAKPTPKTTPKGKGKPAPKGKPTPKRVAISDADSMPEQNEFDKIVRIMGGVAALGPPPGSKIYNPPVNVPVKFHVTRLAGPGNKYFVAAAASKDGTDEFQTVGGTATIASSVAVPTGPYIHYDLTFAVYTARPTNPQLPLPVYVTYALYEIPAGNSSNLGEPCMASTYVILNDRP